MARGTMAAPLSTLALVCSCATANVGYDYAPYRAHMPRSILVLPPLNDSNDVDATYSYLSTISRPLGECGYYVFPVAIVDAFMKDNGLPTPGEMHTVSLAKLREVFGADAVLYIHIEEWGQKYQVLVSTTVVRARATLVDTHTGTTIWEGSVRLSEGSGDSSGGLVGMVVTAAVEQIVDSVADHPHALVAQANQVLVLDPNKGMLHGHRHPGYADDARGR
jgi:hypothetical protein